MSFIHLFVTLKISDNTARTALHAARTRMGFDQINFLKRAELWEFDFPTLDASKATVTVEELVSRTAYFINPNKHYWIIKPAVQSIESNETIKSPYEGNTSIMVYDHIDGKAESTYQAILPLISDDQLKPQSLRRAIWWDLFFDDITQEEKEKITQSLAVSKTRKEGLFSNPHFQSSKIFLQS